MGEQMVAIEAKGVDLKTRRRCVCSEMGMDGTRHCYPPMQPHRHLIRLEASKSPFKTEEGLVACDNHVQFYLSKGWTLTMKLCQYCCLAEAVDADSCMHCLDKMTAPTGGEAYRLKKIESGWCLNRDTVLGCTHYAQTGTQYCVFCTNHNLKAPADMEAPTMGKRHLPRFPNTPRARARTVPNSTRPCTLTPSCAGRMTAAVRLVEDDNKGPELWWACPVCRTSQRAPRAKAVPAPETLSGEPSNSYSGVYGPEPVNAEMAEASAHIRTIMQESED